jgi:predicted peptidase
MKRVILSISVIFTIICFIPRTASFGQASRFDYKKFVNEHSDKMNYRLLSPDYDTIRKYPLVVFLHGSGESGNDNEAQLKWGVMNFATDQAMVLHPAFVLVPQCPAGQSWSVFDDQKATGLQLTAAPTKPFEILMELIHDLVKKNPIDTSRIYITGLSMGGFGTFEAIERYPYMFAAAVPVCGGGDVSKAASIAHVPIWIFEGSEDAGVDPRLSMDMAEALIKAGGHPGITLYPEVGHFSWLAAYTDPLMIEWLFRQHRK